MVHSADASDMAEEVFTCTYPTYTLEMKGNCKHLHHFNKLKRYGNKENRRTPCPVQSAVRCRSACTLETWPPRREDVCTGLIRRTTAWWSQGTASTCSPWTTTHGRASSSWINAKNVLESHTEVYSSLVALSMALKFSSGTSSHGWSQKKGLKTAVMWWLWLLHWAKMTWSLKSLNQLQYHNSESLKGKVLLTI